MLKPRYFFLLLALGVSATGASLAQATPPFAAAAAKLVKPATPAAPTGTAQAAPGAPPPAAIAISDIAIQAEEAHARLHDFEQENQSDQTTQSVADELDRLTRETSARIAEARRLLNTRPSLDTVRALEPGWSAVSSNITALVEELTQRASSLDHRMDQITRMAQIWDATHTAASAALAPSAVLGQIDQVSLAITHTRATIVMRRGEILDLQTRAVDLSVRVTQIRERLASAAEQAANRLFQRDSPAIWTDRFWSAARQGVGQQGVLSLSNQILALRAYSAINVEVFALHAALFVMLSVLLLMARVKVRTWTEEEPDLRQAQAVFESPIAMAILIATILSRWFYPQAPRLLWELIALVPVIPTVIIVRRIIERHLHPLLFALAGFYLLDRLRGIATPQPALSRLLLVLEAIAGISFLAWTLRRDARSTSLPDHPARRRQPSLRTAEWITLVTGVVVVLVDGTGYSGLGELIGGTLLQGAYLALVLYALLRVIEAIVIGILHLPPFAYLMIVRKHRRLLATRIIRALGWVAALLWLLAMIRRLGVWDQTAGLWRAFLGASIHIGSVNISVEKIAAFCIALLAALWVSRFVTFALDEEVYPKFKLERGLPYVISTMLRYAILFVGFVLALAALGIDMTQFTILAGAFSVGLGFGLQNIVNNFVSGLIVLFERPVKVGDIVQFGDIVGEVERIGIRASVVHTSSGAEVIIPNGTLISNTLTNWTLTSNSRRVDINVSVALGNDPEAVKKLLLGAVDGYEHEQVATTPATQVLLTKLGPTSLDFEVRIWVDASSDWAKVKSDLTSNISLALKSGSIAFPP